MAFNSGFKGLMYYSKSALHVSGDVFAHHQEHLTVFTASGSVRPSCCRLVSWMSRNWTASDCGCLLASKSALHVSGDVFAHHQEHLTVFTVSGSVRPSCCRHQPSIAYDNKSDDDDDDDDNNNNNNSHRQRS